MHIVQLANFYGPRSGGLRTALHHLGAGYVTRGHTVTLIVPGGRSADERLATGVRRLTVAAPRLVLAVAIDRHQHFILILNSILKRRLQRGAITAVRLMSNRVDVIPRGQQFASAVGRPIVHNEHIAGVANHFIEHWVHMRTLVVNRQRRQETGRWIHGSADFQKITQGRPFSLPLNS